MKKIFNFNLSDEYDNNRLETVDIRYLCGYEEIKSQDGQVFTYLYLFNLMKKYNTYKKIFNNLRILNFLNLEIIMLDLWLWS